MILIDFDNPTDNAWLNIETIVKDLFDRFSVDVHFGQSTLGNDDNYALLEFGKITV